MAAAENLIEAHKRKTAEALADYANANKERNMRLQNIDAAEAKDLAKYAEEHIAANPDYLLTVDAEADAVVFRWGSRVE